MHARRKMVALRTWTRKIMHYNEEKYAKIAHLGVVHLKEARIQGVWIRFVHWGTPDTHKSAH